MMDRADMGRRLQRLMKRPLLAEKPTEYLEVLLDDALSVFLEYTHRICDPGEPVDALLCRMVVVWTNMEGAEGSTSAEDGDIKRTWEALPSDIQRSLKHYRLVVGISAVHGL